jgi:altronate dehydratase
VNAEAIIDEGKTIEQVGLEKFEMALKVTNGRQTCAEANRSQPFNYLMQRPAI